MSTLLKTCLVQVINDQMDVLELVRNSIDEIADIVQINNVFYITGTREQMLDVRNELIALNVEFTIVYIAITTGAWADGVGLTPERLMSVRRIVNPKFNYSR
jgi:hypothetical protein